MVAGLGSSGMVDFEQRIGTGNQRVDQISLAEIARIDIEITAAAILQLDGYIGIAAVGVEHSGAADQQRRGGSIYAQVIENIAVILALQQIAQIEKEIGRLGKLARDGGLSMADMQGGTFTITNGGVYGSLMSSPILNAPQSGILGMHKIQDRPVVVNGQIVIRPMMYLALSYDHRIVDGKGAVTFLVRVKEALEDPRRLLMDL